MSIFPIVDQACEGRPAEGGRAGVRRKSAMISLISILKFDFFDLDFKVQQREVPILKFDLVYSVVSDIIKEIHRYPSLTDDASSEQARPPT